MKENEKSIADNDALKKTNELNKPTTNNMKHTTNQPIFQPPPITAARNTNRLSQLPRLPERRPLNFDNTPTAAVVRAVCAGCNARLDTDDAIQQTFTGCRKCVGIYGRIDAAIEDNTKRKVKETLAKMAGGRSR